MVCRDDTKGGKISLLDPYTNRGVALNLDFPLPHTRDGGRGVVASACMRYAAHFDTKPVKKHRGMGRLGAATKSTTTLTLYRLDPRGDARIIKDIPVSPYELRVWFAYDCNTCYYSFISDAPRSTSWADPGLTETQAQTRRRKERMANEIAAGKWMRRIVGVNMNTFETMSVRAIALTAAEKRILTVGPDHGQLQGWPQPMYEHIYASMHQVLYPPSVTGLVRTPDHYACTASSVDYRRHMVSDRTDPSGKQRVWVVDVAECMIWPVAMPSIGEADPERMQWHRWYVPGSDEFISDWL